MECVVAFGIMTMDELLQTLKSVELVTETARSRMCRSCFVSWVAIGYLHPSECGPISTARFLASMRPLDSRAAFYWIKRMVKGVCRRLAAVAQYRGF